VGGILGNIIVRWQSDDEQRAGSILKETCVVVVLDGSPILVSMSW